MRTLRLEHRWTPKGALHGPLHAASVGAASGQAVRSGHRARYALRSMPSIGPLELVILLVIVLLIFGPKRLPGLGRQLGSGMREFKDSITGKDKDDEDEDAPRAIESSQAVAVPPAEHAEPAAASRSRRATSRRRRRSAATRPADGAAQRGPMTGPAVPR